MLTRFMLGLVLLLLLLVLLMLLLMLLLLLLLAGNPLDCDAHHLPFHVLMTVAITAPSSLKKPCNLVRPYKAV